MNEKQLIKAIEDKRKLVGLSQEDLSNRSGISRVAYGSIIKGKSSPRLRNYLALCKELQITLNLK
jgi:transcriptional regulator with XRE-family HTH domain